MLIHQQQEATVNRPLSMFVAFLVLAASHATVSASTLVVDGFGVGGWSSWETRSKIGTLLIGTNDSNPYAATYFGVPASAANDTAIEKQINFMSEGETIKAVGGENLPASPAGSLNGGGYVRLDGTDGNSSGKSDISYVDSNGIAAASALTDAGFSLSYRYYIQPYSTSARALYLNFGVVGTDGANYTFASIQSGSAAGWNSASVSGTSGIFAVYKNGSSTSLGTAKSLQGWSNDSVYGSVLFGSTSEIIRVGFNVGNSQPNAVDYLDSVQTTLLNGGDLIDFQAPSASQLVTAVPLPSAAAMGLATLATLAAAAQVRKKIAAS